MKTILIFLLSVFSIQASAHQLSCTGSVWVKSVFFPLPIKRSASVVITTQEQRNVEGAVVISVGGDPIAYKGPLFLDGQRDHVAKSDTGEYSTFRLAYNQQKSKLKFQQTLFNAESEVVGSVSPAELGCQTNLL